MRKDNKPKFTYLITVAIILVATILIVAIALILNSRAAFNTQINYQGRLLDDTSAPVADDDYAFVFSLCTDSAGITCVWTESQTVSTLKGLFSVMLGSVTPFGTLDFNQDLWLKVSVGGNALSPLRRLGAVPAAFEAAELDGKTWEEPGEIGLTTPNTGKFTALESTGTSSALVISGDGSVISFTGAGVSQITTATDWDLALMPGGTGKVGIGAASGLSALFNVSIPSGETPGLYINNLGSGYSLRVDDEETDATPFIVDTSGKVGIGTATPATSFHINGVDPEIRLSDSGNDSYVKITKSDTLNRAIRANQTLGPSEMDSYTKLALYGNGNDGSAFFIDSSPSAHTMTAIGNTQVDTAQSVLGGSSIYFDGASDAIVSADSDDWYFGSGDYTVDTWVRRDGSQVTYAGIIGQWTGSWFLCFDGSNGISFYIQGSTTVGSLGAIADGTWTHIAVVRSGNSTKMYINGVASASVNSNNYTMVDAAAGIHLGSSNYSGTSNNFKGWVDNIRISKGIARWTGNFTPPSAVLANRAVWNHDDNGAIFGDSSTSSSINGSFVGFNVSGIEKVRVDYSGRLGVGTSAPVADLHLNRASASDTSFLITNSFTGSTITDGSIIGVSESGAFAIQNQENTDMYFNTNASERMRIKNDGKIGIGTSSPSYKVHTQGSSSVDGTIATETNSTTDNYSALYFMRSRGSSSTKSAVADTDKIGLFNFMGYTSGNAFDAGARIWTTVDGTPGSAHVPMKISFYTGDATNYPAERMTIKPDGSILKNGVTTTPMTYYFGQGAGAATVTDCDASSEYGRIYVNTTSGRSYYCTSGGWQ